MKKIVTKLTEMEDTIRKFLKNRFSDHGQGNVPSRLNIEGVLIRTIYHGCAKGKGYDCLIDGVSLGKKYQPKEFLIKKVINAVKAKIKANKEENDS